MEKKYKVINVKDIDYKSIDFDYGGGDRPYPIDELITFLNNAKDVGATNIKFEVPWGDDVNYVDLYPVKLEFESDKDFEQRKQDEESNRLAAENVKKAREKALYEELKEKYGN